MDCIADARSQAGNMKLNANKVNLYGSIMAPANRESRQGTGCGGETG